MGFSFSFSVFFFACIIMGLGLGPFLTTALYYRASFVRSVCEAWRLKVGTQVSTLYDGTSCIFCIKYKYL